MAQPPPSDPAAPPPVELKDPVLAAFLAWLIPGLGHWYQGRRQKAVLFFVCIMGIFTYGVFCLGGNNKLGYGRAVYFAFNQEEWRLYYFGQMWVGLPALPALIQAVRVSNGEPPIWHGFMAPPRMMVPKDKLTEEVAAQPTIHDLQSALAPDFDYATTFTMIAGLLNILAIYDAYAGPVVVPPSKRRKMSSSDKEIPEKTDAEKLPA
ncbi:MAG: hypothetical protein JXB10_10820 [Pirellulales bacterium]|nr:hypothetical protein [Pirellulales bacterium]